MAKKKIFFSALFIAPMFLAAMVYAQDGFSWGKNSQGADEFVGAALSGGPEIGLDELKGKIKEKGAKWQAGETSISKLSKEERAKRIVGADLSLTSQSTPQATAPVQATAPTLDWRNNGGNYVTPVKDQGSCGSCWAFATTATAESAALIKGKTPYDVSPLDLSEQVMVSCSGAGSCSGGYPTKASGFLASTGLPAEACYKYSATNGTCASACANWQAGAKKIDNYVSIAADVASIKNALASFGPVSTVMSVYSDFYYYKSGVYSYAYGSLQGGHAVTIVGYDDATQSFLVKNSWGTGWGEAGYFHIAYSEMSGMSQFGRSNLAYNTLAPDTLAPTITAMSPADGSSISGTASFAATASDNLAVSSMEGYIDGVKVAASSGASLSFSWNTKRAALGAHAVKMLAKDAAGNSGSKTITVYVGARR